MKHSPIFWTTLLSDLEVYIQACKEPDKDMNKHVFPHSLKQDIVINSALPLDSITVKHTGGDGYIFDHVDIYLANGSLIRCGSLTTSGLLVDNEQTMDVECLQQ